MNKKIKNSIIIGIIVVVVLALAYIIFIKTTEKQAKLENNMISQKNLDNKNINLNQSIPQNFNDLNEPSNVTKVQYGTSGEGRPLYYYKIGNGNKILLMTFAIHGFEDGWPRDGYQLVKMAENLISKLAAKDSQDKGLNGWSVYIIPSANPDGLLDGYTNNGPGRCQISKSIDINRDFTGNFKIYTDPRNKTGDKPFEAPEAVALKNLVDKLMTISPDVVVVDTHGWLDATYGFSGVAKYFDEQFDLKNRFIHVYDGGYFVGYAKDKGAKSVLVELPKPENAEDMEKKDYNQKMVNAVENLIDNYKF